MKDVYEQFNTIDMNVEQYQNAEVSDLEKAKLLKDVKRNIRKPKPSRWKKKVMAIAMSFSLSSAALFGLSFTTFAYEIPIIGSLFQLFNDEGLYNEYGKNTEQIGTTKEDAGIKITMNETIFDGKTLYINYTIESETDLGTSPMIMGIPELIDSTSRIYSASQDLLKVGKNKYIGMTSSNLLLSHSDSIENGSVEFIIEEIIPDESLSTEAIKGNWDFHFDLTVTENTKQLVNKASEQSGVTVEVKEIVYTPMSFLIYYDEFVSGALQREWDFISTSLEVTDDLGNVYANQHSGGFSNSSVILHHVYTFEKLDPKAKKLIITPILDLAAADGADERGSRYRNINSTAPMEIVELEDIIIEIE